MTIKAMADLKLKGKRVLIREDYNVPMKNGRIVSDTRIKATIPTIRAALKAGAQVMLMSHLGRPIENSYDEAFSLAPVAHHLSKLLKMEVPLITHWLEHGIEMGEHKVVLLENVRFHHGEIENNQELSRKMASLCDVYVMDAFATSHRQEASTYGIIRFAKQSCIGPLMQNEIQSLQKVMDKPARPIVAIVGGAKVSTKLSLLTSLIKKVDYLIVGGGIANTFLAANGYPVGKSLYEPDALDIAANLMAEAKENKAEIPLPIDVVVAVRLSDQEESYVRLASQVDDDEKIFDIGPDAIKEFAGIIKKAKTILWNGPVGAFEIEQFSNGTRAISKAVAESKGFKVAGGGDTLVAIEKYQIADKLDYVSTGGGAFLSFLEGKPLPALQALEEHQKEQKKKA